MHEHAPMTVSEVLFVPRDSGRSQPSRIVVSYKGHFRVCSRFGRGVSSASGPSCTPLARVCIMAP
eukprot:13102451-Alexandrium_andersonii.AAC.1